MRRLLFLLISILFSFPAMAHDLLLKKEGSEFVLRYGHHDGTVLPINAAKLKQIQCIDAQGQKTDLRSTAVIEPKAVRFKATCKLISLFYYDGFSSVTPDGEKNLPKNQVKDAVKSWESKEFIKFIDTGSGDVTFGDEFEITVGGDIRTLHTGDNITVRVLYQGAPVAGAVIEYNEKVVGKTDATGSISISLKEKGQQLVEANLKRPLKSPEADSVALSAGLLFEVAP